jgi:hypothetical protein
MDPAIVVAVIALVGAILSAGISVYAQASSAERAARRDAEAVLAKYREPLVLAAYDLQSRLFNILSQNFLGKYYVPDDCGTRDYARDHTLYLIGQYFAWTEIMRREIQFLRFEEVANTREVARLQHKIRDVFASDSADLGRPLMIWRGEQSAIGERMTTVEDGQWLCMGYASFVERKVAPEFWRWFERLAHDIDRIAAGPNPRLRELQHRLVDLIELLDPDRIRFQESIDKAESREGPRRDSTTPGGERGGL